MKTNKHSEKKKRMREREERDYLGCDLLRKDQQWVFGILGKRKRVLGEADSTVAPTQKT
jgi:hypothetical protein